MLKYFEYLIQETDMAGQELKIASWNTEDALSKAPKFEAVVERIKSIDADVVSLAEAFSETALCDSSSREADCLMAARTMLAVAGYGSYFGLYHDTDGRKDRHGFMILSRTEHADDEWLNFDLGSRQACGLYAGELGLTVAGVHFDDRRETGRLNQAGSLLQQLYSDEPNVIMGDLNTMHHSDNRAAALRMVGPIARRLPSIDPGEPKPDGKVSRIVHRAGSLSSRLSSMASGYTMDVLTTNGYRDADDAHRPTMKFVQLDHIMTNFTAIPTELYITDFNLHAEAGGESDHRPISATIER
jgi:endonuclease/exonuclease/phosphatase family metal-dependent hydrolase